MLVPNFVEILRDYRNWGETEISLYIKESIKRFLLLLKTNYICCLNKVSLNLLQRKQVNQSVISEAPSLPMDSGTNATPPPPKTVFLTVLSNSELQKIVKNRSLVAGGVAFEILQCWKDVHLQTSEYSLQDKYKGQVTTITENVQCSPSYPWDWSILCSGKCAVCSMK